MLTSRSFTGGENKKNTDMVVAIGKWWMNHDGGTSAVCNKKIEITYGGKTVDALVVDQCCICDDQDLDMRYAFFFFFFFLAEPDRINS